MFALIAGVGIVTGCTGPALGVIDMKKMEVVGTVAKIGQGFSSFGPGNILVVAAKTEIVGILIIRTIEISRIKAGQ